ncbi:hypothetical protein HMPREF1548_01054 [Clostridium sp. KLE 1755]|nr:hypothetical protein HMPREF1548_01054 [Clostridium sp. KLE 1755]
MHKSGHQKNFLRRKTPCFSLRKKFSHFAAVKPCGTGNMPGRREGRFLFFNYSVS